MLEDNRNRKKSVAIKKKKRFLFFVTVDIDYLSLFIHRKAPGTRNVSLLYKFWCFVSFSAKPSVWTLPRYVQIFCPTP